MRVFLLAILLISVLSSTVSFAGTPGEVRIGSYLREATMKGINGDSKTFSDYKGKPLIINIWASWCGPCRAEMGSLQRLAEKYKGKFNVIGISIDDDGHAAASFIKHSGVTFDNFLDSKLFLEYMLGATTIPLTVLVDAHGRVLEKIRGAYVWDSSKMMNIIGKTFHLRLAD